MTPNQIDKEVTTNDLNDACQQFLEAARKYREFLKKNYPDRLFATIYVEDNEEGGDLVLYSESQYHMDIIKEALTDDTRRV